MRRQQGSGGGLMADAEWHQGGQDSAARRHCHRRHRSSSQGSMRRRASASPGALPAVKEPGCKDHAAMACHTAAISPSLHSTSATALLTASHGETPPSVPKGQDVNAAAPLTQSEDLFDAKTDHVPEVVSEAVKNVPALISKTAAAAADEASQAFPEVVRMSTDPLTAATTPCDEGGGAGYLQPVTKHCAPPAAVVTRTAEASLTTRTLQPAAREESEVGPQLLASAISSREQSGPHDPGACQGSVAQAVNPTWMDLGSAEQTSGLTGDPGASSLPNAAAMPFPHPGPDHPAEATAATAAATASPAAEMVDPLYQLPPVVIGIHPQDPAVQDPAQDLDQQVTDSHVFSNHAKTSSLYNLGPAEAVIVPGAGNAEEEAFDFIDRALEILGSLPESSSTSDRLHQGNGDFARPSLAVSEGGIPHTNEIAIQTLPLSILPASVTEIAQQSVGDDHSMQRPLPQPPGESDTAPRAPEPPVILFSSPPPLHQQSQQKQTSDGGTDRDEWDAGDDDHNLPAEETHGDRGRDNEGGSPQDLQRVAMAHVFGSPPELQLLLDSQPPSTGPKGHQGDNICARPPPSPSPHGPPNVEPPERPAAEDFLLSAVPVAPLNLTAESDPVPPSSCQQPDPPELLADDCAEIPPPLPQSAADGA